MTARVLVTGASGFIGRQILPLLLHRGYEVHATSTRPAADGAVRWHQADLLDRDRVGALIETVKPSHLLHLAWYTAHRLYWTAPDNLRWVEASLSLLSDFVACGGERAVLAGTCAEYDWRFGYCSEAVTPLNPATLYGACKNSLQAIAAAYARQVGLSLAWGRIFFVYGPHEQPQRLVPSVIRSVLKQEPVRCSHGRQIRDFLHVEDLADGFATLLSSPVEGPVNLASGQPISIREIVETIAGLISDQRHDLQFGAVPVSPDDPPLLVADVRRLNDELGWSPRVSLESGLARTLASIRNEM